MGEEKECQYCKESMFKAQHIKVSFSPEETANTNAKNAFLNQKIQELFEAFNRGNNERMDQIFTEVYNFNAEAK